MKKETNNTAFSMDSLERRAMMSASPSVVGYLPDYQVHNVYNESTHKFDKIDWGSLTQINYFSLVPNSDASLPTETSSGGTLETLEDVVAEAHAHGVKVNIVIGGAELDTTLGQIVNDADLHETFAENLQEFADRYHVDGIDLDWEKQHPSLAEIANYGELIETVQEKTSGLTISAAVYAEKLAIPDKDHPYGNWDEDARQWQLDAKAIASLDQIGIMDYDLDYSDHSPFDRAAADMDAWASHVGAANVGKLLFGVPFYGKAGYGWDENEDGSKQNDEQAYSVLVDTYLEHHSSLPSNTDAIDAAYEGKLGGASYAWHFNGIDTIQRKTQYALDKHFGGVMVWDLGLDHVDGTNSNGGNTTDRYSLLSAIGRKMRSNGFLTTPAAPIVPNTGGSNTGGSNANNGVIDGTVYYDGDWNGRRNKVSYDDSLEMGRSGVTVFLDANDNGTLDNGEKNTQTDANGHYTFSGLTDGTYHVRAQKHAGYFFTTADKQDVTISNGHADKDDVLFGELVTYRHIF